LCKAWPLPIVIAKHAHPFTLETLERGQRKGGHKVPCVNNEFYLVTVEEMDCLLDPGDVIMGVRHQSDLHADLIAGAISHLTCGVKDTSDDRRPKSVRARKVLWSP
jgi:hypothetical protein